MRKSYLPSLGTPKNVKIGSKASPAGFVAFLDLLFS